MFITNNPSIASYAEESGINRIFIDLEIEGKIERQGHLDTHITTHKINDIEKVKQSLKHAELLVRVNPYSNDTFQEVDKVIEQGADIIMLPMFVNKYEVENFVKAVNGRAKVCLLLETPQAFTRINEILEVSGIDEVHVGLNDLSLGLKIDFMFEILSEGLLDYLASIFKDNDIRFGFGGIARVGEGILPAELIIREHARLGSELAILSRSFIRNRETMSEINSIDMKYDINQIKKEYSAAVNRKRYEVEKDRKELVGIVRDIAKNKAGNSHIVKSVLKTI